MAARSERFDSGAPAGVMLHALRWEAPGAAKLVLLHGGGANAHWWDALAPELARRFDVTALDFRGHGDSDHPDAIVPGAFERDLEALLARLAAPDALLLHAAADTRNLSESAGVRWHDAHATVAWAPASSKPVSS